VAHFLTTIFGSIYHDREEVYVGQTFSPNVVLTKSGNEKVCLWYGVYKGDPSLSQIVAESMAEIPEGITYQNQRFPLSFVTNANPSGVILDSWLGGQTSLQSMDIKQFNILTMTQGVANTNRIVAEQNIIPVPSSAPGLMTLYFENNDPNDQIITCDGGMGDKYSLTQNGEYKQFPSDCVINDQYGRTIKVLSIGLREITDKNNPNGLASNIQYVKRISLQFNIAGQQNLLESPMNLKVVAKFPPVKGGPCSSAKPAAVSTTGRYEYTLPFTLSKLAADTSCDNAIVTSTMPCYCIPKSAQSASSTPSSGTFCTRKERCDLPSGVCSSENDCNNGAGTCQKASMGANCETFGCPQGQCCVSKSGSSSLFEPIGVYDGSTLVTKENYGGNQVFFVEAGKSYDIKIMKPTTNNNIKQVNYIVSEEGSGIVADQVTQDYSTLPTDGSKQTVRMVKMLPSNVGKLYRIHIELNKGDYASADPTATTVNTANIISMQDQYFLIKTAATAGTSTATVPGDTKCGPTGSSYFCRITCDDLGYDPRVDWDKGGDAAAGTKCVSDLKPKCCWKKDS
jgi:hypothetical protein